VWIQRDFPATSRWRYRWVSLCIYVRSQSRVPGKPMKFGEDRTMYAKVMSDYVFFGEQWWVLKVWGSATDTPFRISKIWSQILIPHGWRVSTPSLKPSTLNLLEEFDQMRGVEKGKMAPICKFNPKWPTSCWSGAIKSVGCFVRLGMTKACSEFRPATQN